MAVELFPAQPMGVLLVGWILVWIIPVIRYVIGLKHWRTTSVVMFLFSIYLFLTRFRRWYIGLGVWVYIFLFGFLFGIVAFRYLQYKRMHFYVKSALISLSILLGNLLALLGIRLVSGVSVMANNYVAISVALLFVATYEYLRLYVKRGLLEVMRRAIVTVGIPLTVGALMVSDKVLMFLGKTWIWWIIATVLVLVAALSKWRFLTITEFLRFRSIVENDKN